MSQESQNKLSRRTVFAGVGVAGAAAAVAAVSMPPRDQPVRTGQAANPEPDSTGYRVTEHVRRYYQTTRV